MANDDVVDSLRCFPGDGYYGGVAVLLISVRHRIVLSQGTGLSLFAFGPLFAESEVRYV